MSLSFVLKLMFVLLVAALTLAGWVGLVGPFLGLAIGFAALTFAFWFWRETATIGRSLIGAVASVGVPGVISALLGVFDASHERARLMSINVIEFSSQPSVFLPMSTMTNCSIAEQRGLMATAVNAWVKIYIKDPLATFYASSTLPDVSVGEQICLEEFAKMRETEPELFTKFQEFWPNMPQIPKF